MTTPITTYPSIIANNLKHFEEFFSKPQLEHFAQYLTGLIVSDNRTVQGINDAFVFHKDQSNLNRFITEAEWSEEKVEQRRIELIKHELKGMSAKNGVLYLDDTILHKRGWYFSKEFTQQIERLGKDWVTQCKTNRKVVINNRRVSIGEWLKGLPAEKFKRCAIGEEIYYCFQRVCLMSKQGWVKVIAYYKKEDLSDDLVILVSNRLDWDEQKIISIYQGRWSIETFYEDSKQNLGFEDYKMRKLRGITRHWYLIFLAYTLLQIGAFDRTLRRWLKANIGTIGEKCRFTATEIVRTFILFILRMHKLKYDTEEIMTLIYLPKAKLKFVPVL